MGNSVPSSITDYSGTNASLSDAARGLGDPASPFSLANMADPAASIASGPVGSPNVGPYSGLGNVPSTFSGLGEGIGTGNPSQNSTNFGDSPTLTSNLGGRGDDPDIGEAGNAAAPSSGIGPGTGTSPSDASDAGAGPDGGGPGGPGDGGGGPAGGGAGAGDGAFKRGGRVPGQRPDPRRLSAKLKTGDKVQAGVKKPGQDDVPVRLIRGETVVNKPASDKFGPVLDQMNKLGNRAGGMSVGRR
jgi:hypothetical protein